MKRIIIAGLSLLFAGVAMADDFKISSPDLAPAASSRLTIRLRKLFLRKPGHGWTSAELAAELGVSEATLRRRLQQEGTSVRSVLTDVRMTHAMQLLQCSRIPVSEIAASTGFESQSRFAIRFRHRFGFPPSAVRGMGHGGRSVP